MIKYKIRKMPDSVTVYYKITDNFIFTISISKQLGLINKTEKAKFENFGDNLSDCTEKEFKNAKSQVLKLLNE